MIWPRKISKAFLISGSFRKSFVSRDGAAAEAGLAASGAAGAGIGELFSLAVGAFAAFSPGKGRAYFEGWLAALNLLLLGSLALKAVR